MCGLAADDGGLCINPPEARAAGFGAAWSSARPPKAPAGSSLAAAGTPTKRSQRTRPVPWTGITARGSTAEGYCGEVIPCADAM